MAKSRQNARSGPASELELPPEGEEIAGLVQANPHPPDLNQPLPVLEYLFKIEMERIEVARKCEQEHGIVFPETTIIIRDIQKLLYKIIELRGLYSEPDDADDDETVSSADASIYGI